MLTQSGGNSSPSVKAQVQESPVFFFSPPAVEQLQRSDPWLVEIHAGVLIRGDAFEASEHEAHELRLENMPSGEI